ncbi:ABC transporter ATP-binding protein [Candidatus Contubernalis alkalaceticus]|nr:ABC transporter ATP-binding protein [Candidatus Contubernalis alkalaceticus]
MVSNLLKKFNDHIAVKNISFEIPQGIIFGLLGPNGAGKSTVISMMSGLFPPDAGEITIGGYSILQEPMKAKNIMGVVPQEIALYPTLTARENLMFWGRLFRMKGKYLQSKVDEVLEMVSLTERANERIENYSGGMKRRINIAAGLLHNPGLLLLDEPTVGVDPQSRRNILETIKELNRQGMTVVYTSHYMEEVEELCQSITIMDLGKIIASGSPTDLIQIVGNTDLVKLELNRPMEDFKALEKIPAVKAVSLEGTTLQVTVNDSNKTLVSILAEVTGKGFLVSSIKVDQPNLETVFLHLTGRTLRN